MSKHFIEFKYGENYVSVTLSTRCECENENVTLFLKENRSSTFPIDKKIAPCGERVTLSGKINETVKTISETFKHLFDDDQLRLVVKHNCTIFNYTSQYKVTDICKKTIYNQTFDSYDCPDSYKF
uniref:ZP domain-containing protein n=1 Tax=Strongyloides venezuelensis TaxID=75913 RepID=A0A0K0FIL4_STRVS